LKDDHAMTKIKEKNINIIETYVFGKVFDGPKCEDMIAVSNDFIAVFDGASSKSDIRYSTTLFKKLSERSLHYEGIKK